MNQPDGTALNFQPRFGKYLLLKRIAKGGMAEIFRSLAFGAEGFAKLVVVKRMLPTLSGDHKFVDMFIDEAKLTAHLAHGNIAQLMDFGIIDEMLYHCLEYVQGRTLADIFEVLERRNQPPPLRPICKIIAEALYGLDHAHQRRDRIGRHLNIIHRDVSPSNVMVSYDGEVKIVDFGIARATHTRRVTQGGKVQGKMRYMSPEQAKGELVTQRSDQYSLAVCFYELLTMKPMFSGQTGQELVAQVEAADIEAPRKRNPEIPERLNAIIMRALSRAPEDRYASAAEMRDELEAFLLRSGLFLTDASLGLFMAGLFHSQIQTEREQIAREVARAEASRRSQTSPDGEAPALKTVIIKQDQLPADWDLYPLGEDREDTDETEKPAAATAGEVQTVPGAEAWSDETDLLGTVRMDADHNARTVLDGRPLGAAPSGDRKPPAPPAEAKQEPTTSETGAPTIVPRQPTMRSEKMLTKPPKKKPPKP